MTCRVVLLCRGGDEREGEDGESGLEDMLNANISPPVSCALAETIGWILFDMDEQYALCLCLCLPTSEYISQLSKRAEGNSLQILAVCSCVFCDKLF